MLYSLTPRPVCIFQMSWIARLKKDINQWLTLTTAMHAYQSTLYNFSNEGTTSYVISKIRKCDATGCQTQPSMKSGQRLTSSRLKRHYFGARGCPWCLESKNLRQTALDYYSRIGGLHLRFWVVCLMLYGMNIGRAPRLTHGYVLLIRTGSVYSRERECREGVRTENQRGVY